MRIRPITIAASGVALALLLAACGSSGASSSSVAGSSSVAVSESGSTADIAFAQLMIPHHQQAIEMSDLALARETSPDVKALAEQIKGAQDPEIQMMQGWLANWGAPMEMDGGHGGHDMGGMEESGMMTQEDMTALAAATGQDFDRMWLTMMIAHHQGAITMAQDVLATSTDADVTTLAQAVIDGQTTEITEMQNLLAG